MDRKTKKSRKSKKSLKVRRRKRVRRLTVGRDFLQDSQQIKQKISVKVNVGDRSKRQRKKQVIQKIIQASTLPINPKPQPVINPYDYPSLQASQNYRNMRDMLVRNSQLANVSPQSYSPIVPSPESQIIATQLGRQLNQQDYRIINESGAPPPPHVPQVNERSFPSSPGLTELVRTISSTVITGPHSSLDVVPPSPEPSQLSESLKSSSTKVQPLSAVIGSPEPHAVFQPSISESSGLGPIAGSPVKGSVSGSIKGKEPISDRLGASEFSEALGEPIKFNKNLALDTPYSIIMSSPVKPSSTAIAHKSALPGEPSSTAIAPKSALPGEPFTGGINLTSGAVWRALRSSAEFNLKNFRQFLLDFATDQKARETLELTDSVSIVENKGQLPRSLIGGLGSIIRGIKDEKNGFKVGIYTLNRLRKVLEKLGIQENFFLNRFYNPGP